VVVDDPLTCMARGTGFLFADEKLLAKVMVLPNIM